MQLLLASLLVTVTLVSRGVVAAPTPDDVFLDKRVVIDERGVIFEDKVIDERAIGPDPCIKFTEVVGDGNPHVNYYTKQVTPTVSGCGASNLQCSSGATQETSFDWSIDIGAEIYEWISGGFSVGGSIGSGTNEGCAATGASNVCMWYEQAYVAYTVRNVWGGSCARNPPSDPFILWSPMDDNRCGIGYYCVQNTCQSENAGYWTKTGPVYSPDSCGPHP